MIEQRLRVNSIELLEMRPSCLCRDCMDEEVLLCQSMQEKLSVAGFLHVNACTIRI